MLKRLNGNNGYSLKICAPKDSTKIIEDPKEISKVLSDYWCGLGESRVTTDEDCQNTLRSKIKQNIDCTNGMTGFNDVVIDSDAVFDAINKLKYGKSCGVDNIPN